MTDGIIVTRVELDSLPEVRLYIGPDGSDAFLVIPTRDGTHIALHASSPDVPLNRMVEAIREAQNTMRVRRGPDQRDADFWALIEGGRQDLDVDTGPATRQAPLAAISAGPALERECA